MSNVNLNLLSRALVQFQAPRFGPGLNFVRRYFTPTIIAAEKLTSTTVRVDFNDALRSYSPTSIAGNYTVTGPSVVTVSSVAFTPGNSYVVLTVSGPFASGTYTVAVAGNTVQSAADDGIVNLASSCSMLVSVLVPAVVAAEKLTATTVRIDFNQALRSLAATTVAGNYSITGPSTVTVASVAFTPGNSYVVLTLTGTFAPGTYTVTVSANTVQSSDEAVSNASGSCSLIVETAALLFSAKRIGSQVRVDFGQALRSLPATTVTGNYTFSGPQPLTTASVVFTPGNSYLLLNLNEAFATGQYTLSIAANTVEMQALDIFNQAGTSVFEVDVIDDVTPPSVSLVSPLSGVFNDTFAQAVIDVTDPSGLALLNISVQLPISEEVIYRAGQFTPGYLGSSVENITAGYRLTILRRAGWPVGTVIKFNVDVVDLSGNKA